MNKKQAALIILDGWGYREEAQDNAIAAAKTPFFDSIWQSYPHSLLYASEEYVGLPKGQVGNSEIGHTTIGAGRVIFTDLERIGQSIINKSFHSNPAFKQLFDHIKKHDSTLHIKGLLGPGGVHAHSNHLFAFLEAAKDAGITKIAIHVFTDGRDTPPQSSAGYIKELEDTIERLGIGFIATASGRFYAMDRDKNWDRLQKVEDAIFHGKADRISKDKPSELLSSLHKEGALDELLEPVIFADDTGKSFKVEENDGIFIFNFRSDRARMLSQKILEKKEVLNLYVVTMTEYDKSYNVQVAFPPEEIETTLAKEVSNAGLTQAHIAETEKFPHATYFLNGGKEEPHKNEEHILIESRKDIKTHDQAPKMRAKEIADAAIKEIEKGTDFIFINFANPDMVGHTANVPAIIEALEEVDAQLKRVLEALQNNNGQAIVTADHGNAEVNIDPETGTKHTAHTINQVPVVYFNGKESIREGALYDLAPTLLELLDIEKPQSMTGESLINR